MPELLKADLFKGLLLPWRHEPATGAIMDALDVPADSAAARDHMVACVNAVGTASSPASSFKEARELLLLAYHQQQDLVVCSLVPAQQERHRLLAQRYRAALVNLGSPAP